MNILSAPNIIYRVDIS